MELKMWDAYTTINNDISPFQELSQVYRERRKKDFHKKQHAADQSRNETIQKTKINAQKVFG